ncbi:MAG: sulfatase family protein [Pirellulaceae bacterium]
MQRSLHGRSTSQTVSRMLCKGGWTAVASRLSTLVALGILFAVTGVAAAEEVAAGRPPNILFVFADQWRADALGFAGDVNVKTPHLDDLAKRSLRFVNAVSGCPVCCPYRATLMTGRRPLSHGVFLNDVPLPASELTMAEILAARGYQTAYIGKWHLDGRGRSTYIPAERRQGFEFFQVLECTHNYFQSSYFAGDDPTPKVWDGYDATAQTQEAIRYMQQVATRKQPFLLVLSWGPPHNPYETAPEPYRAMYRPEELQLRPNVPAAFAAQARKDLAGYYAHCSALDRCVGSLVQSLEELSIADDTILVFTSDHGDLLYSHGQIRKQQPWDESIRVPLLVRFPRMLGVEEKTLDVMINSQDLLPTLLGLAGIPQPATIEGLDFSAAMQGGNDPSDGAALLQCPTPFGEWTRTKGGREYRGLRTRRYTYVRTLEGPWLLLDNQEDPFQLENIVNQPASRDVQAELDALLQQKLRAAGDEFLPGPDYIQRWGYVVDDTGTASYRN